MANRLLYMCSPQKSISDVANAQQPKGYGLTCLMFGTYGVGFKEYCQANHLRVPSVNENSIYNFIQGIFSNGEKATKVAYHVYALRGATAEDVENPQGTDIKAFFKAVKGEGIPNSTMAKLTNLTVAQVEQEQNLRNVHEIT